MPVYLSPGVKFVLNIKDHRKQVFNFIVLTNWVYFTTFLSNKSNQIKIKSAKITHFEGIPHQLVHIDAMMTLQSVAIKWYRNH